jgi:hypothetical protein
MIDFLVRRDDFRQTRVAESETPSVGPGEALLRVDCFGLTANNVTYAVFGEAMSYWDFFPTAEEGWGRVPMWGFAEVEASEVDGVEPGTRLFGYLPPSSHLLVRPVAVEEAGFVDGSPHREPLPSVYQRYVGTAQDPFYRAETEAVQMLLRPLFFTSFMLDDQLADDGLVERGPVVISSASSKTALAAAFPLKQRDGVEVVGLTSARSREFVEGLDLYDRVATYDDVAALGDGPATFVDIAGDSDVRRAVHQHFGDRLAASVAVGVTHWERPVGGEDLPGPRPEFFFAPTRIKKRSADWGRDGLSERTAAAWDPFCEWVGGWLETIPGTGFDAVQAAFLDVLEGRVDPRRAHVLSLS